MDKKPCALIVVIFIGWSSTCAFGQVKDPNAVEVLRCYKDSLSWLQSVSMKVDINVVPKGYSDKKTHGVHFVFRHDHGRTEWIGEIFGFDEGGNVDPNNTYAINEVITGQSCMNVISSASKLPILATISKNYEERQKELLDDPGYGGALFGKMDGSNHKGIAELLGGSTNLYLRNEQENINGVSCYVLEATTKHGKVTAWIAAERGYNVLKWTIHKTNGDLFDERPISSNSWLAVFDAVELQKVNNVFVTTAGNLTLTINFADGRTMVSCYKYKANEVNLNPDFEALGAFVFNLPDGTPVHIEEYPGIRYIWQNGKIVPDVDAPTFEEIDKMVDELKKENQANN